MRLLASAALIVGVISIGQDARSGRRSARCSKGAAGGDAGAAIGLQFMLLFFINFAILFGPLLAMGVAQIQSYEPGEADWGVRMESVRGQADAKQEIDKVMDRWQAGAAFERSGGKRERGLLFLGAPGVGKTMLAKAIATGSTAPSLHSRLRVCPDVHGHGCRIVRVMVWKAKRLARKWGGQCIVFIDEIDAVGMHRQSLNAAVARRWRAGVRRRGLLRPVRSAEPVRRPRARNRTLARADV